jgi:hypothetical protein
MGCSLATQISPGLKPKPSHPNFADSSTINLLPIPDEKVTSSRNTKRLKEPEVISYPASFLEFNQLPGIFSNPVLRPPQGITPRPTLLSFFNEDGTSNYDSNNRDKDPRSNLDDESYRYSMSEFGYQPLSNVGLAEKHMNSFDRTSVDFFHFIEDGAKKKIISDFRIISKKGTPKMGTPTIENPEKVDSNREKFSLFQKIADQEKHILLLKENIHFHKQRAVKVPKMDNLFSSNPNQQKKIPVRVNSPPIIVKRLNLMPDIIAQTPNMPGSLGNLKTETKALGGSVTQDGYAPSDPHDPFDQVSPKKKSRFSHVKLTLDGISSSQDYRAPDFNSDLDAGPKKQDIKVPLASSESLRKKQSSPTIPKGQYSSERNTGFESGKKQSGVKRRRLSSKSIAFPSPNSNF